MTKKPAAPSPLPDLFTMENGKKFSSRWLSQAIWSAFKKPLDADPFESEVHDYVMRRVNQGPAFDAMVEALEKIGPLLKGLDSWELARDADKIRLAALKLAQETK